MSLVDPAPAAPHLAADDALRCPLCDYDLRGLTQNRCPECGHAFDPDQLRATRSAAAKSWLFEQAAGRTAPIAFVATTLRSLWPVTFWRRLAATDLVVRTRLTIWALTWSLLIAAVPIACFASSVAAVHGTRHPRIGPYPGFTPPWRFGQNSWRPVNVLNGTGPFRANVGSTLGNVPVGPPPVMAGTPVVVYRTADWNDAIDVTFGRALDRRYLEWALALMAWPIVVSFAMRLFTVTMRRAGVRGGHLLRCARYPLPSMALAAGAVIMASRYAELPDLPFPRTVLLTLNLITRSPLGQWVLAAAIVASTAHLIFAYARYLRLPHAVVTALLVQCVTCLTIAAGLYYAHALG